MTPGLTEQFSCAIQPALVFGGLSGSVQGDNAVEQVTILDLVPTCTLDTLGKNLLPRSRDKMDSTK